MVDFNKDFDEYDAENEDKDPSKAIIIDIQATEEKKDEINALKLTVVQETEFRTVLKQKLSLVTTNVPYKFSSGYKDADKKLVLDAIADFNNRTCVRFEPRKNETTYLLIDTGSG
ncbi:uncharacterized protein LOC129223060 [Uloborus diversus]|uniref:uncharacterized protein LOC129223060 n=1 Tax=Uloborus diversus TaxID=327109 RepID=UPI002409596D|nr:uncharacterized protein LOC129223060 [Uloborus diversus]